ncbi:MAG: hypothetical protein M1812_002836 [Candelaria pacifica]|nr:MAG: hypothetical protein M1812_002836 [Candelaria pacifica]
MDASSNISVQAFRFPDLPREIRDMIYEATQQKNQFYILKSRWSLSNDFNTALRLVSRQLSNEATAVFYNTTTFNFNMDGDYDDFAWKPNLLNPLVKHATKLRIAIVPNLVARKPAKSTNLLPSSSHSQHSMALNPWGRYYRLALKILEDNVQEKLVCLLHAMPELRELVLTIEGDLVGGCRQVPPTMSLDGLKAIKGLRKVSIRGRIDQECAQSLEIAMQSTAA